MCAGACLGNIRGGTESEGAGHTGHAAVEQGGREGLRSREDRSLWLRGDHGCRLGDREIDGFGGVVVGIRGGHSEGVHPRMGRCGGSRTIGRAGPAGIAIGKTEIPHARQRGRHKG